MNSLSQITDAFSPGVIVTSVLAIAVALAGVYALIRGARTLVRMIGGYDAEHTPEEWDAYYTYMDQMNAEGEALNASISKRYREDGTRRGFKRLD